MAANDDPIRMFLPSFSCRETMDTAPAGAMEESDTDFFNSAYNTALNSPGQIFTDDTLSNFPSQSMPDKGRPNAMNPADSHSAGSSPLDSSSDSSTRHKRNASSNSSQSGLLVGDVSMTDDAHPAAWRGGITTVKDQFAEGLKREIPSAYADIDLSNRAMENDFDFDSAASSPSPPPDSNPLSRGGIKGMKMPFRSPRSGHASSIRRHYGMPTVSFLYLVYSVLGIR